MCQTVTMFSDGSYLEYDRGYTITNPFLEI